MRMKISLLTVLVLLSSVALFLVPGGAQVPKDTLIIGMNQAAIIDFAPARVYEFEGAFVLNNVYDNLVTYVGGAAAYSKIVPDLAKTWEVSSDGLTWTFHLRQDAVFHSGNPVNADAVVFSLRRSLARQQPPVWILQQFVPKPEMIQKVDDYTVAITTNQPLGESLMAAVFSYQGICSILDPTVVKAHATSDDPDAVNWLKDHDAGSGPFILANWVRNDQIVLQAFSKYWGGAPAMKQVIIKDMPEPTAQKLALERGDIDIAWNLLPGMIKDVKSEAGIKVAETPSFTFYYMAMNCSQPPFNDVRVRQAVRWAIDYNAITNGILEGAAAPCQTIEPVGMPGHLDLFYSRDVAKAKELLKEAGYPNGFNMELLTRSDEPYTDIAAEIKQNLADIGINVKVTAMVYSQLLALYRAQKTQAVLVRWGTDYPDPSADAAPFAHCRTPGPDATVKQLAWRNMYCPTGVSDLVEQAAGERDSRTREIMYKEIQAIVLEEGAYVIIDNPLTQIAMRDNVQGLQIPPMWYYAHLSSVSKT